MNTVIRDLGSTLFGFGILIHQTIIAKDPHGELLVTALVLLGVPGATGLLALWLNGRSTAATTVGSGSSSPAVQSQPP